MSLLTIRD